MTKFKIFVITIVTLLLISVNSIANAIDKEIIKYVADMEIDELLGQKIIIGPPWFYRNTNSDNEKVSIDSDAEDLFLNDLIGKYKIGNFFLCDQNYRDWQAFTHRNDRKECEKKECKQLDKQLHKYLFIKTIKKQTAKMHSIVKDYIKIPPIMAADFEGGTVQHFRGKYCKNAKVCKNECEMDDETCKSKCDNNNELCKNERLILSQTPSPMSFAATHDPVYIEQFGEQVAKLYKELALTTNFAPLLDLKISDNVSIIGTRSFGANEHNVEIMAYAYAKGMIKVGIAPVFKHWPDLGTSYLSKNKTFYANTDLHELRKPLTIHTPIKNSTALYNKLLKKIKPLNYAAVMTAHVNVEQYKDICNRNINTVSLCKEIIDKELRGKLSNKDTVIISDDFAYLKATRKRFDTEIKINKTIKRCFDAGHDMIILGSTIPNLYFNDCDWKHNLIIRSLKLLYEEYTDEDKEKLQESVQRIIAWKYNIYKRLYNLSNFEEFKNFGLKKNKINLKHLKHLKKEMTDLSNKVLKNSILIVGPYNISPKELANEVNLHELSNVLCIGPKYSENDLRVALEDKLSKDNINNIDLEYNFNLYFLKNYFKSIEHDCKTLKDLEKNIKKITKEITKENAKEYAIKIIDILKFIGLDYKTLKELEEIKNNKNYFKELTNITNKVINDLYIQEFIKVKSKEINSKLFELSKDKNRKIDCFIFGLINKPAHIKIFENVYSYYKDNNFYENTKLIVVSFSTPSLFNESIFQEIELNNIIFISSFSNSFQSNKFLVEALFNNKYVIKSVINSPIKINKYLSEVAKIEPLESSIYKCIKRLNIILKKSIVFEVIVYLFEILISLIFIWKILKKDPLISLISTFMGLILFVGINKLKLITVLSSLGVGPVYILDYLWPYFGIIFSSMIAYIVFFYIKIKVNSLTKEEKRERQNTG